MAPGQNAYTRSCSYDRIGNITYKSDVGSYAYTYNNQPHAVRTAGAVSLQYDLAGNMTQKVSNGVTLGITWNADNKPTLITRNGSDYIQYTYDGMGNRVRKVNLATGFVTRYYGEVYEERGTTGVIHLFANTTRIASVRTDGTIQYYHGNHLGSASVITDSTGTVKETMEYLPFGGYRVRQDLDGSFPDVNYTFTDQEDDDETGLYNYRARLYDPLLGRFISADSIVPEPGNLQAFNRYSYCVNNPLVYVDPSGHWFGIDDLIAAIVGAVVGGVSAAIAGENILEGAAIGAAAGWVGWNTGLLASQQITAVIEGSLGYCSAGTIAAGEFGGAVLGGAAGGMVAGGMGAGFNGGNIGQGMLTGMYYGAATGTVMGGITSLYGYAKGLPMDYGVGAASTPAEGLSQSSPRGQPGGYNSANVTSDLIVSDPNVLSAINKAWKDSNPGTVLAHEEGGWILVDPETGALCTQRWPSGQQAMIMPGRGSSYAVGHFHTHPNIGPFWSPDPRAPDVNSTVRHGIPGYVRNVNGIVRINPDNGRWLHVWP